MHAKHADRNGLNDLSELVIGCACSVFNTVILDCRKRFLKGFPDANRRGPRSVGSKISRDD
jgi:hypothetical protein